MKVNFGEDDFLDEDVKVENKEVGRVEGSNVNDEDSSDILKNWLLILMTLMK